MRKIAQSQNEDIELLIETITETSKENDNVILQLNLSLALEKQLREELDYYKAKDKNSYIYGNIITPIPGLILMTYGFVEMGKGNTDYGWTWFTAGAITLAGLEVVYQGGHWVLRIW